MRIRSASVFLLPLAVAALSGACSKKNSDKPNTGGSLTATFKPSRVSEAALHQASLALGPVSRPTNLAGESVFGQTVGTELESVSFRITRIELCGTLETQGTGTQCSGSGAWSIYGEGEGADYDTFLPADAAADTTNYTNFLDADAMSALGNSVTYSDGHVQSYDSVLVYWYRPFKIKASMTMNDGTKLYTKASTDFQSNGKSGLDVTYYTNVTNMTTAPAEEGVFFLPNGGTYFRLPTKFEITQADVDAKTNFKVVFAFDPEGMVKGTSWGGSLDPNGFYTGMSDAANGFRITAPFLQIAPVIAREGETIMREVYLLRSADSKQDVRLSLYYVKEDSEKSILAVTTTNLYNAASTSSELQEWGQVNSVEVTADGKVNFKDWGGHNVIGGLTRMETAGAASTTVEHVYCAPGVETASDGTCSGNETTEQFSYALVGIGEVESTITAEYSPPPPEEDEDGE